MNVSSTYGCTDHTYIDCYPLCCLLGDLEINLVNEPALKKTVIRSPVEVIYGICTNLRLWAGLSKGKFKEVLEKGPGQLLHGWHMKRMLRESLRGQIEDVEIFP